MDLESSVEQQEIMQARLKDSTVNTGNSFILDSDYDDYDLGESFEKLDKIEPDPTKNRKIPKSFRSEFKRFPLNQFINYYSEDPNDFLKLDET